jgi:hypothetical protein
MRRVWTEPVEEVLAFGVEALLEFAGELRQSLT